MATATLKFLVVVALPRFPCLFAFCSPEIQAGGFALGVTEGQIEKMKATCAFLGAVFALLLSPASAQGKGFCPCPPATAGRQKRLRCIRAVRSENWFHCDAGRETSPVSTPQEDVISTEEGALEALWGLEDDGSLVLGMREVKLNATLPIAASHIVIAGAPGMTRVRCPPRGSAFVIRWARL